MMNYNHLYYLNLSQPSLSIQIKTLEGQIGFKLFEKKGRNVILTERGQKVFSQCSRMFQVTQDLFSRFDEKDNLIPIKVAISSEVESSLILELTQNANRKMQSSFKVKLIRLTEKDIISREGSLDIDIFLTNRFLPATTLFELYKSVHIPINLFQSRVHKVVFTNLILPGENLILRNETDLYLSQNSIKNLSTIIETDFISSMIRAVIDGYGICYLPISYMLEPMQEGLVIKNGPKKGFWKHSLNIYWKKQDYLIEWINRIQQMLSNSMKV